MEDYPRTLSQLECRFSTEASCREYLTQLRWPGGFVCPACGGRDAWQTERGLWMCRRCNHQTSVIAGTIFQDTHTPLPVWFRAAWWFASQKYGASALGLQRVLGLGSYRTAWTWLHKLRRAAVRPEREPLSGVVEVDETYVGGREPGSAGRGTRKKALVMIAAEVKGPRIGRIRLQRVSGFSSEDLLGFVQRVVAPGSVVVTDGLHSYMQLPELGYQHDRHLVPHDDLTDPILPRAHRVASLLKRWLLGTHQGGVSNEHLDAYLEEFTFRFNRRDSRHRGKLFYRLLQQAVEVDPAPYASLIFGVRGRKKKPLHKR